MPKLWNRTLPSSRPAEKWKFAAWAPDVLVINLMTNDYVRGCTAAILSTAAPAEL